MKFRLFILLFLAVLARGREILDAGPLRGLEVSGYPPAVREALTKANEDCLEIENFRLPKHARPSWTGFKDGGSRYFFGTNYGILLRTSIFPPQEKEGQLVAMGYCYGYELFLVAPEWLAQVPDPRPTVSKVWLVTEEQFQRFKAATDDELSRRVPTFEEEYKRQHPAEEPDEVNKLNQTSEPTAASGRGSP